MSTRLKIVIQVFEQIGCTINVQNTGHPEWKRGYITHKGVQLGRIAIHGGEYSHVKWYGGNDTSYEGEHSYPIVAFQTFETHSVILSQRAYALAVNYAKLLQEKHYKEKLAARAALPKRKRPSIKKGNLGRYIQEAVALSIWGACEDDLK